MTLKNMYTVQHPLHFFCSLLLETTQIKFISKTQFSVIGSSLTYLCWLCVIFIWSAMYVDIYRSFLVRPHICHGYHGLYLWRKICHVEKFQISVKNLNNLWSFIEIYALFVLNLCGEKSVWRKSVWRKNDKYETCIIDH